MIQFPVRRPLLDSGQFGPSGHLALVSALLVSRHVIGRVSSVVTLWLLNSVLDNASRNAPVHTLTAKVILSALHDSLILYAVRFWLGTVFAAYYV